MRLSLTQKGKMKTMKNLAPNLAKRMSCSVLLNCYRLHADAAITYYSTYDPIHSQRSTHSLAKTLHLLLGHSHIAESSFG